MTSQLIPPSPSQADYEADKRGDLPDLRADDPFALFADWLAEARGSELNDANAMAVATADAGGLPDVRMVLLKDVDAEGFVFYTNLKSAKGRQLAGDMQAGLLFHWKSLRRQVRARGPVERVSEAEADAYFASRARESRIGAWASDQSRPLDRRETLKTRVADEERRFEGRDVPRPPHWSGFRVRPLVIEFWRDRAFRLHERLAFTRADPHAGWTQGLLYP